MAIKTTKCLRPGRCRKHRPYCRHCRKPTRCECGGGYAYPHRLGSPLCLHNKDANARMWASLIEAEEKAKKAG